MFNSINDNTKKKGNHYEATTHTKPTCSSPVFAQPAQAQQQDNLAQNIYHQMETMMHYGPLLI